ncbi:MAG TPA: DUF11 domain-containing protein, partial [Terriglobales bacterium]|nr:DUF11 domain-containing protein [Terriglobales bacterium]
VTDPTPGNNTGNSSVTGRAAANLSVSQVSPASVVVGQSGTKFTVTVNNGAARSDATNVVLTNTFVVDAPTSVSTTAFGTPSQGSCSAATGLGTANITITCNLGSIVSGGQATVDLALTPTLGGTLKNTPSVTGTEVDPVPANNTAAQATITVNTTPPGQQTFNPTDPANGQPVTNVVLSGFILIPGNTTIEVPIPTSTGLSLPANYRFGSTGAAFYNISNTATFNNNGITVCILTPETFFQPHRVRIFRLNPATDITTSTGFVQTGPAGTHKVCGTVSSLPSGGSTFVAMEPINTVPPLGSATVNITGTGGKGAAGTSVTLDGSSVIDPDSFPCMNLATLATTGVAAPTNCVDQNLLIFRWVGNFTDISRIDPVTGLKLIEKDCRQTTPFFDNQPCNKVETSLSLGASTVTLTVLDENFLLNPPAASKTFQVGVSGSSGAGQTQTVSVGQSGTFTFSYTYFANTTFAFVGSPALAANGITCSAQSLTYTGTAPAAQTANVTVLCSTSAPVFGMNSAPGTNNNGTMVAGIVGLTGLPLVGMVLMTGRSRRHRMLRILAIFALITLMVVFQAACGGGTTGGGFGGAPKQLSAGTAKGDYVITVNPTPAPAIPVPTLTLKVQ